MNPALRHNLVGYVEVAGQTQLIRVDPELVGVRHGLLLPFTQN